MSHAHHFQQSDVSVVITTDDHTPRIRYWGSGLGELSQDECAALAVAAEPLKLPGTPDYAASFSVLPEHSVGWMGTPGVSGSRAGAAWSVRWRTQSCEVDNAGLTWRGADEAAQLAIQVRIELTAEGLLRMRSHLTNTATDSVFEVGGVAPVFPVPLRATELCDTIGRHAHERSPQRRAFTFGTSLREGRHGRPGLDASVFLAAGTDSFGFGRGEVWMVHAAWSGNHRLAAERFPGGEAGLSAGELLLTGEIRLGPGETYSTPWTYGAYGRGLDAASARFHTHIRAGLGYPAGPRPVMLNTWEAVYFDHDLDRLVALAEAAARIGVERYVLDDGWFLGRRKANSSLGDWVVDRTVYPEGLHPLVDRVRALGMQFGLWFEPEMISEDSALARAHPDWILQSAAGLPPRQRSQQVLDLTVPDAWQYILTQIDALVGEYGIDYIKWDHNRDLIDAGSGPARRPAVHEQTLAVYRLIDELHRRHPRLEIESCASGGGRVDLGILERTQRIWTSDNTDALERQRIQRWTGIVVPPELMGAHVSGPVNDNTGRTLSLDMRAGTAAFCQLGIEWDVTTASDKELDQLAAWIMFYKRHREFMAEATVVHADSPDPATWVHGLVGPDRARALYQVVSLSTSDFSPNPQVTLPGLAPERRYEVAVADLSEGTAHHGNFLPSWMPRVTLTGASLAESGLAMPELNPGQLLVIEATAL